MKEREEIMTAIERLAEDIKGDSRDRNWSV